MKSINLAAAVENTECIFLKKFFCCIWLLWINKSSRTKWLTKGLNDWFFTIGAYMQQNILIRFMVLCENQVLWASSFSMQEYNWSCNWMQHALEWNIVSKKKLMRKKLLRNMNEQRWKGCKQSNSYYETFDLN